MKYFNSKNLFITLVSLLTFINFVSLFQVCYCIVFIKSNLETSLQPGNEFVNFKKYTHGIKRIGFITNKDMSAERNDGQFVSAQYILAPTILDLNKPSSLMIFDCADSIAAYRKIKELGAEPILINRYGKILARRNQ